MTVAATTVKITRYALPENVKGLKSFFFANQTATGDGSGGGIQGTINFSASQQEFFVLDKITAHTTDTNSQTWRVHTSYDWSLYDSTVFSSASQALYGLTITNGNVVASDWHRFPIILGCSAYPGSGIYWTFYTNTNTHKYTVHVEGRIFNQFPYDLIINQI